MLLDDRGLFEPDRNLAFYFPEMRRSDKGELGMREILAHQSGMQAWIPYWKETVKDNGRFRWNTFKPYSKGKYSIPVTDGLWLNRNYRKHIYTDIRKSPLGEKKYLYSRLTFYIFPEIITGL